MENASETQNENRIAIQLDLPERAVCMRGPGGAVLRHVFRRITAQHWAGFFSRFRIEVDSKSQLIDLTSANLWLYDECILRAEGYKVEGGVALDSLPQWKTRVPYKHRMQAVNLLTDVQRDESGELVIVPECEVVRLTAVWGEGSAGAMNKVSGLIHRFEPPTAAHAERFSREISRSQVVGGSRTGKTIRQARHGILARLYDELVISVEGYAVSGKPLEGREQIAREMDVFHKVAAAGELFSTASDESEEPEAA